MFNVGIHDAEYNTGIQRQIQNTYSRVSKTFRSTQRIQLSPTSPPDTILHSAPKLVPNGPLHVH